VTRAPGPWLRLTASAAAASSFVVVISGELGIAHRVLAETALPPLVALLAAASFAHRRLFAPVLVALALYAAAASTAGSRPVHVGLAAAAFAAVLVAGALSFRGEPVARGPWRDYVTLTKPRIMSLLLLTGGCGMVVGARGWPGTALFATTMLGLALACGGASALNHLLDADIDRLMGKRTERRPVAAGRVPAPCALEFGLCLSAFSFVLLAAAVNLLTAVLALVGNLLYVLVYTRWLKRSTPQNIVIGGAAGAVPPLVGWAAATGNLTLPAFWLFLIVFLWTPPHFWSLALLLRESYAEAKVPMLPVVRGERETVRKIVRYTLCLLPVTLLPVLAGTVGIFYLAWSIVLGALFLALTIRLARDAARRSAALVFHSSLAYLALLFLAMALDPLVG
jgi:protoheme IX farnesyltransferase